MKGWLFAVLCLLLTPATFAANTVKGVRIWAGPDSTRLVLDLSAAADYSSRRLSNPERLEIELKGVSSLDLGSVSGESGLVKRVSANRSPSAAVAVVIELNQPVRESMFSLPPSPPYGHRLVIDLTPTGAATAVDKTVSISGPVAPKASEVQVVTPAHATGRDIIVAIDAGHGGNDPGAVGPNGTHEKKVTFAIAQQLMQLLNQQTGIKAVLTRTGDYYIHPGKRPDVARQKQADLLISIHADAVKNRKAHGASVWVLSMRRATTEVGRMLEQTEQHSELLGGVAEVIKDSANERYLAQTVLDLSMNHSMVTGFEVAKEVVRELGRVAHLHKKEPQAASLAVLKAPDIPSILVETGFISNYNEERLLKDAGHQRKLATALFKAVKSYFEQQPPADSRFAQLKNQGKAVPTTASLALPVSPKTTSTIASSQKTHKVRAGESLSKLARHYGVSMSQLRQHNKLRDDNIKVGQILRIP